jgi:hypothetical protein
VVIYFIKLEGSTPNAYLIVLSFLISLDDEENRFQLSTGQQSTRDLDSFLCGLEANMEDFPIWLRLIIYLIVRLTPMFVIVAGVRPLLG